MHAAPGLASGAHWREADAVVPRGAGRPAEILVSPRAPSEPDPAHTGEGMDAHVMPKSLPVTVRADRLFIRQLEERSHGHVCLPRAAPGPRARDHRRRHL